MNDEAFIIWLLDDGADPNAYDSGNEGRCCALDTAAVKPTTAIVSLLINLGATHSRTRVLHAAVGRRDGEMIPMLDHLPSLGADIEHRQKRSIPSLHTALPTHEEDSPQSARHPLAGERREFPTGKDRRDHGRRDWYRIGKKAFARTQRRESDVSTRRLRVSGYVQQ